MRSRRRSSNKRVNGEKQEKEEEDRKQDVGGKNEGAGEEKVKVEEEEQRECKENHQQKQEQKMKVQKVDVWTQRCFLILLLFLLHFLQRQRCYRHRLVFTKTENIHCHSAPGPNYLQRETFPSLKDKPLIKKRTTHLRNLQSADNNTQSAPQHVLARKAVSEGRRLTLSLIQPTRILFSLISR